MKVLCVLIGCLILGFGVLRVARSEDSAKPAAGPAPELGPTELVASFYKALLQKEEPTLAQEVSLFGEKPEFGRNSLLPGDQGKVNEPVMLRFFRKHRDWFLPKGKLSMEEYQALVRISSPFNFVRTVQATQEQKGLEYVLARFTADVTAEYAQDHTVVFPLDNGKISAGSIMLGGFEGKMVVSWVGEMSGNWGPKPKS
jgi:hypothetical protein